MYLKMDHVSANQSLPVTERENISGARVFDGEDQGKHTENNFWGRVILTSIWFTWMIFNNSIHFHIGDGNRYRMQQLQ